MFVRLVQVRPSLPIAAVRSMHCDRSAFLTGPPTVRVVGRRSMQYNSTPNPRIFRVRHRVLPYCLLVRSEHTLLADAGSV
jgi:hypothetical protein